MAEYFVLAGGKKYLPDISYITTTRFFLDDNNTPADTRDDRGDTPLNVAAFAGQYAAVEELLGHSADVDAKNNKVGAGTVVPVLYLVVQYHSIVYSINSNNTHAIFHKYYLSRCTHTSLAIVTAQDRLTRRCITKSQFDFCSQFLNTPLRSSLLRVQYVGEDRVVIACLVSLQVTIFLFLRSGPRHLNNDNNASGPKYLVLYAHALK